MHRSVKYVAFLACLLPLLSLMATSITPEPTAIEPEASSAGIRDCFSQEGLTQERFGLLSPQHTSKVHDSYGHVTEIDSQLASLYSRKHDHFARTDASGFNSVVAQIAQLLSKREDLVEEIEGIYKSYAPEEPKVSIPPLPTDPYPAEASL